MVPGHFLPTAALEKPIDGVEVYLLRLLLAVILLIAGHFQDARPRVERDQDRVDDELRCGRLKGVV